MRRSIAFLLLTASILAGCQTARWRDFDKIKTGMNKAEVLDLVGGPDRTRRWQGKDRWTYVFKKPTGESIEDVHFEEGKVVYSGAPPVPKISAEEQDRLNEETNVREDARVRAETEADRQAVRARAEKMESEAEDAAVPRHYFEPIQ